MINGMEREQFLRYRMALLPASGFQSIQYRMLEIYATPMQSLVHHTERSEFSEKNTKVFLEVRGKKHPANICGLPFYKKNYVKGVNE